MRRAVSKQEVHLLTTERSIRGHNCEEEMQSAGSYRGWGGGYGNLRVLEETLVEEETMVAEMVAKEGGTEVVMVDIKDLKVMVVTVVVAMVTIVEEATVVDQDMETKMMDVVEETVVEVSSGSGNYDFGR